jgi:hypothetical protein
MNNHKVHNSDGIYFMNGVTGLTFEVTNEPPHKKQHIHQNKMTACQYAHCAWVSESARVSQKIAISIHSQQNKATNLMVRYVNHMNQSNANWLDIQLNKFNLRSCDACARLR